MEGPGTPAVSNDPDEVDRIFCSAIELRSAEERSEYVRHACRGDVNMERRVRQLVDAYFRAGDFLESPVGATLPDIEPTIQEVPGTTIGRYKLLEQIGEGGFAVVFMAEQDQPVRRRVALKIIKAGMDTKQIVARFEAERQALALMDHPSIAKVFDAGATDTGRPYFVMELVKGSPITEYCDQNNLNIGERLRLFLQVCEAVQHAHQKGVIHRDLKPTNVLVSHVDDRPLAKVIDFGIAKATQARLTDKTLYTDFRQLMGTPAYMSPEQADGSLDIDTRSDVYSLGVLLYEILAGSPPFDPKELRSKAFAEMQRIIREDEPPTPSSRLSTLAGDKQEITSKQRQCDPKRLAQLMRGDLDWVVMKCLEKERARRYQTASALSDDVARYLSDRPVEAHGPSQLYRLKKFIRRNTAGVLAGSAVVLALAVGLALAYFGYIRATRALESQSAASREAIEARNQALQARQQAENDRARAQANLDKAREAVQQITQIADEKLSNVPHVEGVRRELLERALQFYLDFLRQESNDRDIRRETAIAYGRAAQIHKDLGNKDKALELMRECIVRLEKLVAEPESKAADRAALVMYYNGLPFYREIAPGDDEVVIKLRRSLELAEQLVKDFPDDPSHKRSLARNYGNLGRNLVPAQMEEAEKYMRRSLLLAEQMEDQVAIAAACLDIGYLKMKGEAVPEAEEWLRRALIIWETLGTQSSGHHFHREMIARALSDLGNFLVAAGKPQEAAKAFRRSVDIWRTLINDYPAVVEWPMQCAYNYQQLGISLSAAGQDTQAETAFQNALADYSRAIEINPGEIDNWLARAQFYANTKQWDKAFAEDTALLEKWPENVRVRVQRGAFHLRQQEYRLAIEDFSAAIKLNPKETWAWHERAYCYAMLGEHENAIADLTQAIELAPADAELRTRRGQSYQAIGNSEDAEADFSKAKDLKR
jgi:serine/threonine protein kinase/Tfp pilus assembly protein PilF